MKKHKRPITVGLAPNTEADDADLALKLLRDKKNWLKGDAVLRLEEEFGKYLQIEHRVAVRSGRFALQAVLHALNLNLGDEVLIQSYTCAAVPNAVTAVGAKPIYVDINPDTFNMSIKDLVPKATSKSKAIIVQHTFGTPAPMDKIIEAAKHYGLFVIEDCAHALGAKYSGKHVGTFGDASIWSFGRDKPISSVFGGMIATKDKALAQTIRKYVGDTNLPSKFWIFQQLLHPILFYKYVLPRYNSKVGKVILEAAKNLNLLSKAVYKEERHGYVSKLTLGKMPNALAILALHQLHKIDKFNSHRRKLVAIYEKELQGLEQVELPKTPERSESIYLRYTIKVPNPWEIIMAGRKKNIILDNWYNPAISPRGTDYIDLMYNPETCPNAEIASSKSLNLPTNITTTEEDAIKVINLVKEYVY